LAGALANKVGDAGKSLLNGVKGIFGGKSHRFVKKSLVAL